ncbi:hypothetical protein DL93DRAFT_2169905 [Clavulina sp. PMI_390]|nr:hypothetical protein DL93DRAFT_2169905 [Clavulina sp. PMI_390]
MVGTISNLPLDILVMIIENLDICSATCLSMTSRTIHETVYCRPSSLAIVRNCLEKEKIPLASFPLSLMDPLAIINLATRRHRFSSMLKKIDLNEPVLPKGKRIDINLCYPNITAAHKAALPSDKIVRIARAMRPAIFPGGRWIAVVSRQSSQWHFLCYDVQMPVMDHLYHPVIVIDLPVEPVEISDIYITCIEYSSKDSSFGVTLSSEPPREDRRNSTSNTWNFFFRLHIQHKTHRLSYSVFPLPAFDTDMNWRIDLSGDYVFFEAFETSAACLWDWRNNLISQAVHPPAVLESLSRRGRFILGSNGKLIHLDGEVAGVTLNLWFKIWTQLSRVDSAGKNPLRLLRHESLEHRFLSITIAMDPPTVSIELDTWTETENEILMRVIVQSASWKQEYLFVTMDKETYTPRCFHHDVMRSTTQEALRMRTSGRFRFIHYIPRMITITFPFFADRMLSIPRREGDLMAGKRAGNPHAFCARSGRLLLSIERSKEGDHAVNPSASEHGYNFKSVSIIQVLD